VPVQIATWVEVKLHGNCHLQFEKCYYSAPYRLVHQSLWLKATETTVQIFHRFELVAYTPDSTNPDNARPSTSTNPWGEANRESVVREICMLRLTRRGLETGHSGTAPVLDPTSEGLRVKSPRSTQPNIEFDLK